MGYDFIKSSLFSVWPALTIVCVSLICIRYAYFKRHKRSFHFYTEFLMLISAIYLILLYGMLTKIDINVASGTNLIPFKEILRFSIKSKEFYYLILGNIAIFVPFGFIVAEYAKPKNIWSNLLIGVIVSSTIEIVQKYIGRSFDIDDIILNTIGCVIGYFVYKIVRKIYDILPDFLKSNWLKNLICIIIIICVGFYIFKVMRIV